MVFQHFGLLAHRRVSTTSPSGSRCRASERPSVTRGRTRCCSSLAWRMSRIEFPDQLSGGMQQRVGVARAFAVNPKVMLYDEPFSALDPLIRRDMQDEICRLQAETGKTMIFITHDLAEALRLGDRIAIMRDGRFVQVGTPEELVGSPADDYVANFTRDIPRSHVLTLRWIMREPAPGERHRRPPAGRRDDRTQSRSRASGKREARVRGRERDRRRDRRPGSGAHRNRRRRWRELIATVAEAAPVTPVLSHRPWWRGKIVQTAAIVALMYVAYRLWALEYPWPNELVWNSLSLHLDEFQLWLLTEKGEEDQGIVFTVFEGFSTSIDHLVDWFNRLLLWMTWLGTTLAGVALVLRFGGLRPALLTLFAFATFARHRPLGGERADAGVDAGRSLAFAAGRHPARSRRGPVRPLSPRNHAVPRRHADRAGVRLSHAGRAPLLDRPRRRSRLDHDLRNPTGHPDHGPRDPGVPVNTVEAATSMGSTRSQLLRKVAAPARASHDLVGSEPEILFALSMVVIAGLIGGGGLGAVVTTGLYPNPALAILAGA